MEQICETNAYYFYWDKEDDRKIAKTLMGSRIDDTLNWGNNVLVGADKYGFIVRQESFEPESLLTISIDVENCIFNPMVASIEDVRCFFISEFGDRIEGVPRIEYITIGSGYHKKTVKTISIDGYECGHNDIKEIMIDFDYYMTKDR